MPMKKKLLRKQIEEMLCKIEALKMIIVDEQEFLRKLAELHGAYRSLSTTLDSVKYEDVDVEEIKEAEFTKFKLKDNFIIFSDTLGVLSVEMGNWDLNKHIFGILKGNTQRCKIIEILRLYNNNSNCNICGSFLLPNSLSIPLIKEKEKDEILSFHKECLYNFQR